MRSGIMLALTLILFCCLMASAAASDRLDTTSFVVVGDGMTAGMRNARLYREAQQGSFPALAAGQMGTIFPLPAVGGPGIGAAPGHTAGVVDFPGTLQTTVREFPPNLFVFNLSVPGFGPSESLGLRPKWPLIDKADPLQTAANFILGFPSLVLNREVPLWTQVEYAERIRPTLVLVALGYDWIVADAVNRSRDESPAPRDFVTDFVRVLDTLAEQPFRILVATVSSPLSAPYFSTLDQAARITGVPPEVLEAFYGLESGDRLTLPGLFAVSNQLLRLKIDPLPTGSVLTAADAAILEATVAEWNQAIRSVAAEKGAVVFDLEGYLQEVSRSGLIVAEREISGDYLGGFYSMDGVYPGSLGHGAIANEFLGFLNQTFNADFRALDLSPFLDREIALAPAGQESPKFSIEELERLVPDLRQRLEQRRNKPSGRSPGKLGPGSHRSEKVSVRTGSGHR